MREPMGPSVKPEALSKVRARCAEMIASYDARSDNRKAMKPESILVSFIHRPRNLQTPHANATTNTSVPDPHFNKTTLLLTNSLHSLPILLQIPISIPIHSSIIHTHKPSPCASTSPTPPSSTHPPPAPPSLARRSGPACNARSATPRNSSPSSRRARC